MAKPIPDDYPRVIPYLTVDGASAAIDFYTRVLGAKERMRMPGPDGKIGHAELAWHERDGTGGGGISDVFALPDYQRGAAVPPSANPGARVGRGVPDVSGDADLHTGYEVLVDGLATVMGGTSAVAPLWSGLIARCNQALGVTAGFLHPVLYARAAAAGGFRDITAGGNGAYTAGKGWDPCTGLGVPVGSRLLAALRAARDAGELG